MLLSNTLILLVTAVAVNAHGKLAAIQGANGAVANGLAIVPGTPGTGSNKVTEPDTTEFGAKAAKDPAGVTGCGKTKGGGTTDCATAAAASLATSGGTVPTANADGTVSMTFHQVNGDGAGPLTAMVSTDMGATWQAATVNANVPGNRGNSGAKNEDFPVNVAVPAGTTCKGTSGSANNVCLVALANPVDGFGGSAPFAMAGAADAATSGTPATAAAGRKRELIQDHEYQIKAFVKRDEGASHQHRRTLRFERHI